MYLHARHLLFAAVACVHVALRHEHGTELPATWLLLSGIIGDLLM